MANYCSPTVIQPTIPLGAMTPLERALLTRIFDSEPDGEGLYFFAEESTCDLFAIPAAELREAVTASAGIDSHALDFVRDQCPDLDTREGDVDLDVTTISWECLFQSIVRRAPAIEQVIGYSAFTCTKMRPDAFGGMVVLITADAILGKSTDDALDDLIAQAEAQRDGETPDAGVHVLMRFTESDVRLTILEVLACDPDFASINESDLTDDDIRSGCAHIVATRDFGEERGDAIFGAALHALRTAKARLSEAP